MGRVEALQNATRLGTQFPAQRLLVVRAIDDEASLALALGRILNYVTAYMIVNLGFAVLLSAGVLKFMSEAGWLPSWADLAAGGIFVLVTGTLGSFLIAARSIHGRELAIAPMECQINTQSAPDASGLSKIVTLVSSQSRKPHRYRSGLRHSIYDHEDCAKVIVSWIRSQP
jgi:hypothetical protein